MAVTSSIVKRKMSIRAIAGLLDREPGTKQIVCSQGAYNHLPKRALAALNKMGIDVKVVDVRRGRRPVTDIERIGKLAEAGLSANEISKKMSVPIRTVYYHLRRIRRALH